MNRRLFSRPHAFFCRSCGKPTQPWRAYAPGRRLRCRTCTLWLPLCERLVSARVSSGWPLEAAAVAVGLSPRVLCMAELGRTSLSHDERRLLANLYGVKPRCLGQQPRPKGGVR